MNKPSLFSTAFCFALTAVSFTAHAHETRIVANGEIRMVVGDNPEPVMEDELIKTDLFFYKKDAEGNLTVPVNTSAGDSFDLDLYVFMLNKDEYLPDLATAAQKVVTFKQLADPRKAFGTDNRYQSPWRPTHDGAIGFYYVGSVTTSEGATYPIDEIFVCGNGHAPDVDHGFSCVADAVTFPGNPEDAHKDNSEFSLGGETPDHN